MFQYFFVGRENILTHCFCQIMLAPLFSLTFFSSANCPISEVGTKLSLCAALVPAALKLKFTLFIRKYIHVVLPVMLETNVPALPCSVMVR